MKRTHNGLRSTARGRWTLLALLLLSVLSLLVLCRPTELRSPTKDRAEGPAVASPAPELLFSSVTGAAEPKVVEPSIGMPTGFQVLAPDRSLPLTLKHLRFARVRTIAVAPDDIHEASLFVGSYRQNDDPIDGLPKAWRDKVKQTIVNVGEPRESAVEWFDPFEHAKTQLALVVFDAAGQPAKVALVQRGAVNVLMKLGQGDGLAWVTSARGEVVKNATVTIMQGNSTRYTTKTNSDGIAKLPSSQKLALPYKGEPAWEDDYYRPLIAVASKGRDVAFTSQHWTTGIEPWAFDIPMAYYYGSGSLVGSVTAERGIYRPGHTVHILGALRKRDKNGGLSVPGGKALVRVLDPDYTSVISENVSLTKFGTFRLETELPTTARLGRYSIEVTVGDTTLYSDFRVAKYRPSRFEVTVAKPDVTVLEPGGVIKLNTRANYFYGAPVHGGTVRYDLSLRSAASTSDDGFSTTGEESWGTTYLDSQEHDLANGVHELELPMDAIVNQGQASAQRVELLVEASVKDKAGDTITGHQVVPIARRPSSVWLKNTQWLADGKTGWEIELKVDGPGSETGEEVTVELYRTAWVSSAVKNDSGVRYTGYYDTTLVASRVVTATAKAQRVKFPLDKGGTYRARAFFEKDGPFAETEVWAYGSDSFGRMDNNPRLQVRSDKESYEPGDTARLMIDSPYKSSLALITLEQQGVLSARVQKLKGSGSEISIPLTGHHLPNVYANVSLVPKTLGALNVSGSPLKSGYAALKVSPEERRLKVDIQPLETEARPGDTVPVNVLLTDHRGKPVQGEVTLWASDEGVLKLTGYQTPDVFSPIYRAHYLGVSTSASLLRFTDLGYEDDGIGGDSSPGADAFAAFRSRFLETAFFSKGVVTNEKGKVTVELPLPDNLTRWRIMATAADTKDRFGSSEASLTTKKPVQVSPSLPRFLTLGDQLRASVVVHNDTDGAGIAQVSLQVSGARLSGDSEKTISVAAHSQTNVDFPVEANVLGTAVFRASVSFNGETDGFQLPLEVLAPTERRNVKVVDQVLTGEQTLALALPGDAEPTSLGLVVESAPEELAPLGAALDALMDYPHGCTEQTTSRLIPMAQLGSLLGGHPVFENERHKARMQEAVVHLLGHQQSDGGFGLWPESASEGFLTAYALWGLQLAQESGLQVPERAMQNAYSYLANNDGSVEGYGYIGAEARKPFAAYVLKRRNKPLPASLSNLFDEAGTFTRFGRTLLVASDPASKRSESLLVNALEDSSEATKAGQWFAGNQRLQEDAGAVMALASRGQTQEAKKFVARILDARLPEGGFGSTQDNLWALTAINQYFQAASPDTRGGVRVSLLGQEFAETGSAHAITEVLSQTKQRPYVRALFPLTGAATLKLTPTAAGGTGRVVARLGYNPKASAHTPVQAGFSVTRRLLDFETRQPVTNMKVGQLVVVQLSVEAKGDTQQVALVDRLPAGLEAVDLGLTSSPRATEIELGYWGDWVHKEAHDERVAFFSNHLSAGSHQAEYLARATRRGNFVHPAARVDAMYQVDVYGIGTLDGITVE